MKIIPVFLPLWRPNCTVTPENSAVVVAHFTSVHGYAPLPVKINPQRRPTLSRFMAKAITSTLDSLFAEIKTY